MDNPIRVAQIGAGGFGYRHFDCLTAPCGRQFFDFCAAADPVFASDHSLRRKYEKAGYRYYEDFKAMLVNEPSLEAVTIVAPIHLHEDILRECLRHDLYIYLEKPPVPRIEQLNNLLMLNNQEKVAVGFQWIASHPLQQAKRWVLEGRLGRLESLRALAAWPRKDDYYQRNDWAGKMEYDGAPVFDGPATNALAHLVHNIMFLGGDKLNSFTEPSSCEGEYYRVRPEIDSYDLAVLRGTLETGPSYHAVLTHACEETIPFFVEMTGTRGWIRIGSDGCSLESSWGEHHFYANEVDDSYHLNFSDFALFSRGLKQHPHTRLLDSKGYLKAVCGGLSASGGIHTVSTKWTEKLKDGSYIIQDGADYFIRASKERKLLSELGWLGMEEENTCTSTISLGD